MVPRASAEWDRWVAFFALGGFLGVFVLALCDHAQNGFFYATEWWPVISSGLAAGFLAVALIDRRNAFLRICFGVLALRDLERVDGGDRVERLQRRGGADRRRGDRHLLAHWRQAGA